VKYNMDDIEEVRLLPFENETMRKIGISEYSVMVTKSSACRADCTAFLTWFIENYPASAQEAKNADTDFWKRFK